MSLQNANGVLDETNLALLRLLQADPRQPVSTLARRVGMSAPAVRERLTRLEEGGVIRGYRLDIDPKALGLPIAAVIRVRPSRPASCSASQSWRKRRRTSPSVFALPARTACC